jgi:hypothetical protein
VTTPDLLQRAAEATAPDPEVWAWMQSALQSALRGKPLIAALGLDGRALIDARLAARNTTLRQAFALIDGPSKTARIDALAKAARRFEAHRWAQWRGMDNPPPTATRLQSLLFSARQFHPLPGARQLHNLLAD